MTTPKPPAELWEDILDYILVNRLSARLYVAVTVKSIEIKDSALIIGSSGEYNLSWLQQHLESSVNQYLKGVPEVERVEFVG